MNPSFSCTCTSIVQVYSSLVLPLKTDWWLLDPRLPVLVRELYKGCASLRCETIDTNDDVEVITDWWLLLPMVLVVVPFDIIYTMVTDWWLLYPSGTYIRSRTFVCLYSKDFRWWCCTLVTVLVLDCLNSRSWWFSWLDVTRTSCNLANPCDGCFCACIRAASYKASCNWTKRCDGWYPQWYLTRRTRLLIIWRGVSDGW